MTGQRPASFRLTAHPAPGHNLIEVTSDFWSGFAAYRISYSDDPQDRDSWRPVPGSSPTVLPPSGTAVWLDRTPPRRGATRWYRAHCGPLTSSPVPVLTPDPAQLGPPLHV